jgi:UDP-N-acetyl-D-galactosamine dehydrogenase
MIASKLNNKENKLAVVGLGYVGLPIALSFARTISVIGFDKNAERVAMLNKCVDPSKQLSKKDFES